MANVPTYHGNFDLIVCRVIVSPGHVVVGYSADNNGGGDIITVKERIIAMF